MKLIMENWNKFLNEKKGKEELKKIGGAFIEMIDPKYAEKVAPEMLRALAQHGTLPKNSPPLNRELAKKFLQQRGFWDDLENWREAIQNANNVEKEYKQQAWGAVDGKAQYLRDMYARNQTIYTAALILASPEKALRGMAKNLMVGDPGGASSGAGDVAGEIAKDVSHATATNAIRGVGKIALGAAGVALLAKDFYDIVSLGVTLTRNEALFKKMTYVAFSPYHAVLGNEGRGFRKAATDILKVARGSA